MRSTSTAGNTLIRAVVVAAAAVLVWIGGQQLFRSEESRIAAGVDGARQALAEARTEDFLAVFEDGVVYQGDQERSDLEGAVEVWKRSGLRSLSIVSQRIEVDGETATASLVVIVGPVLRGIAVDVELGLRKLGSAWRVRSFTWRRR